MSPPAPQAAPPFDALDGAPPRREAVGPQQAESAPAEVGALAAALALVAALFGPLAVELVQVWNLDPNYSHGYFVPAFSLLFAYRAWSEVGWPLRHRVARIDMLVGLGEIALGVLLHLVAWFLQYLLLDVLALICVLRGLLLVMGGRDVNRAYGFAVLFLIFMAPLPATWYAPLALFMQQLVSGISTALLDLLGVPVFRQGYLVQVPGYVMEVGAACSGLRQLTAFVALGAAIGYLLGHNRWYRWTVALVGVLLAIGTNCLRVVLTGLIMIWFGREWADGVWHTIEGLVTLALGTVLLMGTALFLSRWDHPPGEPRAASTPSPVQPHAGAWLVRFATAAVLLLAGWTTHTALARHLAAAGPLPVAPLAAPLADIPLRLGDWSGQELPVTDPQLQFGDEYHQRIYTQAGTGQQVFVWLVYSHDGQDRGHHPEVCMAVAGKPEDPSVRQTLDAPGHTQPIQQYRFGALGDSVWVFYWHYTLLAPPPPGVTEWQHLYQRLRQRPASVTLEVFAPATVSTDLESVQAFVRQLDAAAQASVGPNARRDSRRIPVTLTDVERTPPSAPAARLE